MTHFFSPLTVAEATDDLFFRTLQFVMSWLSGSALFDGFTTVVDESRNPTSYSNQRNSNFEDACWLCPVPFGETDRVQYPLIFVLIAAQKTAQVILLERSSCSPTAAFTSSNDSAVALANPCSSQFSFG